MENEAEERNSRGEDSERKRVRRLEERKERREAKWLQKEGECVVRRERGSEIDGKEMRLREREVGNNSNKRK